MSELPGSVQLIKDWSTWLVGIQTTLLGLVSLKQGVLPFHKKTLFCAMVCFTFSILIASWTLSSLPDIVTRMVGKNDNIHDMIIFRLCPIPLWKLTAAQHWAFIVGMILFALAVILDPKNNGN